MVAERQTQKPDIEKVALDNAPRLWALNEAMGHGKDAGYFERCLELQARGEREVLMAALEGRDVAYAILNWQPKYALFKKLGIPEIQDLNVLQEVRRQGIATAIIEYCESRAIEAGHKEMGIGVGLDSSYGPAQRLYVKRGYIPDGKGVTCDRLQIASGEIRPVDDQMCLMMIKTLIKET